MTPTRSLFLRQNIKSVIEYFLAPTSVVRYFHGTIRIRYVLTFEYPRLRLLPMAYVLANVIYRIDRKCWAQLRNCNPL